MNANDFAQPSEFVSLATVTFGQASAKTVAVAPVLENFQQLGRALADLEVDLPNPEIKVMLIGKRQVKGALIFTPGDTAGEHHVSFCHRIKPGAQVSGYATYRVRGQGRLGVHHGYVNLCARARKRNADPRLVMTKHVFIALFKLGYGVAIQCEPSQTFVCRDKDGAERPMTAIEIIRMYMGFELEWLKNHQQGEQHEA